MQDDKPYKNTIEEKLNAIKDKLMTLEDLQMINKLDIINLKNEIEKIKMATEGQVPYEIEDKIVELEDLAKNVGMFKEWKKTISEVKSLRTELEKTRIFSGRTKKPDDRSNEILMDKISELENEIKSLREIKSSGKMNISPKTKNNLDAKFEQMIEEIGRLKTKIQEIENTAAIKNLDRKNIDDLQKNIIKNVLSELKKAII